MGENIDFINIIVNIICRTLEPAFDNVNITWFDATGKVSFYSFFLIFFFFFLFLFLFAFICFLFFDTISFVK
jgi:hypothetical protein